MNRRQAKKKRKNSEIYVSIANPKRDRNHRIPKQRAVMHVLAVGHRTRNHRIYPEDVIRKSLMSAKNLGITLPPCEDLTPRMDIVRGSSTSWSIREISTHPTK